MAITSRPCRMPCSTPDPAPRHRDDPPAKRTWWVPVLRMSVAAAVVAAIPHTSIQLPFADGAWMLHTAAGLIFMVGAIDSLFLFAMRHKP
ncbi:MULTISPECIES: hypothetical protein [unclassified Ralstonia]|nr:hypothetical protein [Ralstonia sp. LMG 32965]